MKNQHLINDSFKEKKLSNLKVSKETGLSRSVIRNIRNGKSVTLSSLLVLIDYLDLEIKIIRKL